MPRYERVANDIFTVTDLLSQAECRGYIEIAEAIGFEDAPINGLTGPQRRPELRNNSRVMLDDDERSLELWERIREYVPQRQFHWEACGVNERLRIYRYDIGQQFDWHGDGAFTRENGIRSMFTYMVYLNDDFQGGATLFKRLPDAKQDKCTIVPKSGMALVFLHPLLHKGDRVTKGRKYAVRTDVMYRLAKGSANSR